jgi:hypothetical protein
MIKICYWDMDGTFIDTPHPDTGKVLWSEFYGKPYPHLGWWGRLESMDLNVFTLKPRPETLKMYNELQGDNILHFIHTSRMPKFESVIKQVLDMNNVHMDGIMTAKGDKNKGQRIVEHVKECIANGVGGDNSWGALPHEQYQLKNKEYSYGFVIKPKKN